MNKLKFLKPNKKIIVIFLLFIFLLSLFAVLSTIFYSDYHPQSLFSTIMKFVVIIFMWPMILTSSLDDSGSFSLFLGIIYIYIYSCLIYYTVRFIKDKLVIFKKRGVERQDTKNKPNEQ